MTVRVPSVFPTFDSAAARTAAMGSSIRLAQPLRDGANHLLGNLMSGNLCWSCSSKAPADDTSRSARVYAYRHPNCGWLSVWVYTGVADDVAPPGSDAGLSVTAGTGTTVSAIDGYRNIQSRWHHLIAPWGAADSGFCEVVVEGTNVGIRNLVIDEAPRLDMALVDSDLCIESFDAAAAAIGLREARYIGQSSDAGPLGLLQSASDAWSYTSRHGPCWIGSEAAQVNSALWTNPFGSLTFEFRARQKKSETSRDHRAYARTWCDATVTEYQWRVDGDLDTVTSAALSHTSPAWTGSPLTNLAIRTTSDDSLVFQMRRTAGSGAIYCEAISMPEEES